MRATEHSITGATPPRRSSKLPSWRAVATAAGVVVTAVLILELGIWYFVALIGVYAALDVAQRVEMRRAAHNRMAILSSADHKARRVAFFGLGRHCERAAWIANRLGWIACAIEREGLWRRSVRFRSVAGAAPLSQLLTALNDQRLATRIELRGPVPSFGRRLSEHGVWDGGGGI